MYKVYGLVDCNYCKNATLALQAKALSYAYFSLDKDEQLLEYFKKEYSWATVPIIVFVEDDAEETFIGGYDNLIEHLTNV